MAGASIAGLAAIAFVALSASDATPRLAGAHLVADGHGGHGLWTTATADVEVDDLTLDDLPMIGTTVVAPGVDGRIVLLVEHPTESALVEASPAGEVVRVGPIVLNEKLTAFGVASAGAYGVASEDEMLLSPGEWRMPGTGSRVATPFEVGSLAMIDDDSVLIGSRTGPQIAAMSTDGRARPLLGPSGDPEARVASDDPLGPIVALTRLGDERIVFVADTDEGYRLYLLDDTAVRPVPSSSNPVRSSGTPAPSETGRRDRLRMTPLGPGPDGRVLTVGLNDDDVPEINLVDVDTGDTELIATLDGVEPTVDEPVSAALAGDDLVFTAHGSIWRLADATGR